MTLLGDFRAEAQRRGYITAHERWTPQRTFEVVRDMPYRRASDRAPETIVREWRGTCSGKHVLLAELLGAMGHASIVMLALHEFTPRNSPWLPPELLREVEQAPLPDVHTFLRVQLEPGEWTTVDATWPLGAKRLGMPVNEGLESTRDQQLACDPDEFLHVPPDADPHAFKQQIVERYVGEQRERRDRFIEALSDWLEAELR